MKPHDQWESRMLATIHLETRAGKSMPVIRGQAAPFGSLSEDLGGFRERIEKGAFDKSVRGLRRDVAALREHNPELLLGRQSAGTLKMREDSSGLQIKIDPPNDEVGRSTVSSIRRGDLTSMSFGFVARDFAWVREMGADVRVLKDVELFDVSVVTFPAFPDTSVAARSLKSWNGGTHFRGSDDGYAYRQRKIEIMGGDSGSSMRGDAGYAYRRRELEAMGSGSRPGAVGDSDFPGVLRSLQRFSDEYDRRASMARLVRFARPTEYPFGHHIRSDRLALLRWASYRGLDLDRIVSDFGYWQTAQRRFLEQTHR